MNIELTTCKSGDWEILSVDGSEVACGHHLDNSDWIRLLENYFGTTVNEIEISDEEMESRC